MSDMGPVLLSGSGVAGMKSFNGRITHVEAPLPLGSTESVELIQRGAVEYNCCLGVITLNEWLDVCVWKVEEAFFWVTVDLAFEGSSCSSDPDCPKMTASSSIIISGGAIVPIEGDGIICWIRSQSHDLVSSHASNS
jgi:hypothetical protein